MSSWQTFLTSVFKPEVFIVGSPLLGIERHSVWGVRTWWMGSAIGCRSQDQDAECRDQKPLGEAPEDGGETGVG